MLSSISIGAGSFMDKDIGVISSPDGRPCTFSQLKGISNVDDTGNSWIVIKEGRSGYKEMTSMLLAAKMAGKKIHVSTTGQVQQECGHAEAYVV